MTEPRIPTWLEEQIASAKARMEEIPEKYRPKIHLDRHEPDGRECQWMLGNDDARVCITHNSYKPLREKK